MDLNFGQRLINSKITILYPKDVNIKTGYVLYPFLILGDEVIIHLILFLVSLLP